MHFRHVEHSIALYCWMEKCNKIAPEKNLDSMFFSMEIAFIQCHAFWPHVNHIEQEGRHNWNSLQSDNPPSQSISNEQQSIKLYYKFEKNHRLEAQTTVFSCMSAKSFAKCKHMSERMSGIYFVSTQIWAKWGLHRGKTVSMKILHYLTIPLTKPGYQLTAQLSNNGLINGSVH